MSTAATIIIEEDTRAVIDSAEEEAAFEGPEMDTEAPADITIRKGRSERKYVMYARKKAAGPLTTPWKTRRNRGTRTLRTVTLQAPLPRDSQPFYSITKVIQQRLRNWITASRNVSATSTRVTTGLRLFYT